MTAGRRLLIVGCGDLGGRIGRLAAGGGWRVFGLRRSARALPAGIEAIRGDVTQRKSFSLPPALDALIYAVSADRRDDESYRCAYPLGLAHTLEALERAGAAESARVLFVSSTGVYGDARGAWVDETTPAAPASFTGRRMLEAEGRLVAAPFHGASLRLGGIYGPGRTRLLESVRAGTARYAASSPEWTNRIHVEDAARAALHALGLGELPEVLNVVDTEPARRRDVLEFLARSLDVPAPEAEPDAARPPRPDRRVRSQRLAASGFSYEYPTFREGYRALIEG